MPTVTCPVCGNTVFALPAGPAVEIKGGFDIARCKRLGPVAEGEIEDALECEEMEKAVEAALPALRS